MSEEKDLRDFARKRLKKQQEFKQYLGVWVGVSILTAGIWYLTSPESYFWPIWVMFGMGVGALFAGIDAYGPGVKKVITESDVDAEVERLRRKG
ncbi:MAG: hypothetical protein RL569_1051 [Actinomycetota bacterium]|jgi:hypothetical protein